MKISVDIDCTPEEARRFLGLPDMAPIHEAWLGQLKTQFEAMTAQGLSPDLFEAMLKSWTPMGDAGFGLWRQMFERAGAGESK